MLIQRLIITFCTLFSLQLSAQGAYGPLPGSMAAAHFQDGQSALLALDYRDAIRHFRKALDEQSTLTVAHRLIGQCHVQLGDYPEAANEYIRVIKRDSMFSRLLYYELGDCYYKMNEPEIALTYFNLFEELQSLPPDAFGIHGTNEIADELIIRDRLANTIKACEMTIDSAQFINITEIHSLGQNINSSADDYFPFLTNDQRQLYFTRRNTQGDEDLYYSEYRNDQWRNPSRIKVMNTDAPEGMSTLVRNGRRLFYTACMRDSVAGPCDIWEALINGEEIENISSVGAPINSVYWESQAAVSCDGTQLFFASNRPGGMGGTDIYMSKKLMNGNWSLPVNLGAPLNTPGDEEAPFISNDGTTLYFSSTGHLGLGDQDIFMSWWDTRLDRWSMPINIGPPVNGPHRELGFYLSSSGKNGFFASDRPGGEGGMDIYRFELSEQLHGDPITFVEGTIRDSVTLTGIPAKVSLNGREAPIETDAEGHFFLCAGADETLDLQVEAIRDYRPYHNQFFIPEWENREFYTIDLLLRPTFSFLEELEQEEQELKSAPPAVAKRTTYDYQVLFGFDSSELDAQSLDQLETLVNALNDKNVLNVEIIGYSDDIGAQSYNMQLSEERAKAVAVFLLNRSVGVNDIHIEGKGTIVNDKNRAFNRRVDIKITVLEN